MAEFSAYPALNVNPPPNMLDMAGKAAALNGQLLQNTGMGLEQHMTRMATLARAALTAINPDGTADPAKLKAVVLDQHAVGNINAQESANAIVAINGLSDPVAAGNWTRAQVAGIGNAIDAVSQHMLMYNFGDRQLPGNTNQFASGGLTIPSGTMGMTPEGANGLVTVQNPDGSTSTMTAAQAATRVGGNPNASVGGGLPQFGPTGPQPAQTGQPKAAPLPAASPVTAAPVAPSGPQIAQSAMTAIGAAPMPANALTGGNAMTAGAAPVATGQPINIPAGTLELVKQNTDARNQDIAAGTDPNIPGAIGNLQAITAGSGDVITGPGSQWITTLGKIFGTPGATERDIMDKEQGMLAQVLGSSGSGTDANAMAILHITPGASTQTPAAIRTTAALTLGALKYKMALAKAASSATDVAHYNDARSAFIASNPTPLMYALPSMPKAQQAEIWKYVSTLPDAEQADFVTKFQKVQ